MSRIHDSDSVQILVSAPFALFLAGLLPGCGGGGSGAGGGGGTPPVDLGVLPHSSGLVSAAAGDGSVQLRWDATDSNGAALAIALFRSTSLATLYQGAPATTANGAGSTVVGGLANGTRQFFGLALDQGGGSYAPVGVSMSAVPGAPIHVDDSSTAVNPDGSSAALAFPTLAAGIQAALNQGGGNVWIAAGTYNGVAFTLPSEVALYGGFAADFQLATRDPAVHETLLRGGAGAHMIELVQGSETGALDGLTLDAHGQTSFAVDIDSIHARLSSLVVRDTASHGIRLRSSNSAGAPNIDVVACLVTSCGGEGLSALGTFDLDIAGSRFSSNVHEGVSLGQLVAPNGVPASLRARDCDFFGNGEDGLDCQLGAPPAPGGSSSYSVRVEGSRFEENGWLSAATAGLRIDIDFELVAGWSADIVVRGSSARANRGDGILLDLDSTSSTLVHRVLASANRGDGLRVTSETTTSLVAVSSSAFLGNGGLGLRASLGNVPVSAAHCVFAGNAGGGFASSSVTSLASSSTAWIQPAPFAGVQQHYCITASDELDPAFQSLPIAWRTVTAASGTLLTLDDTSTLAAGDTLEFEDDGALRTIGALVGANQLELDSAPAGPSLPAGIARHAQGSVAEDYSLPAGSPAADAGMPPAGGGAIDAGPLAPAMGGTPGRENDPREPLFRISSTTPATTTALGSSTQIVVRFRDGTLSAGSVAGNVRARDGNGTLLAIGAAASAGTIVVQAPAGGWPQGALTLELHEGIATTDGTFLTAPAALPFNRP